MDVMLNVASRDGAARATATGHNLISARDADAVRDDT